MFKSIIKGLLFILAFTVSTATAQQFYRLQADFSIKEKNADSTQRLTVGKVYYDKTYQKIVYIISFPEPEVWVIKDTMLYRFKDNKLLNKQKTFLAPESSIFHLALSRRSKGCH